MEDLVTIVVAIIGSGFLNTVLNCFIISRQRLNGNQQALRLVMKDRLRFLCMHYVEQGWIYEDELEDLIVMHKCYHNDLKGNGWLDELMNRVKRLEIRGVGVR